MSQGIFLKDKTTYPVDQFQNSPCGGGVLSHVRLPSMPNERKTTHRKEKI
jgi:hypothetical protein